MQNTISLPEFYILLSLATAKRHGYDIMKTVVDESAGKVTMGPGTLYGAIKRMLQNKLIAEVSSNSTRRRYYELTEKGKKNLDAELERYQEVLHLAEKKNILSSFAVVKTAFVYVKTS